MSTPKHHKGDFWVWLNALGVAISLLMVIGLTLHIAYKGITHFWPKPIEQVTYQKDGQKVTILGERMDDEPLFDENGNVIEGEEQILYKIGNRKLNGLDFRWIKAHAIVGEPSFPAEATVFERLEWGNAYGFVKAVLENGQPVVDDASPNLMSELAKRYQRARELHEQIIDIEKDDIGAINYRMEQLRLAQRRLELDGEDTPEALASIERERQDLQAQFAELKKELTRLNQAAARDTLVIRLADGRESQFPLVQVVRYYQPNQLGMAGKIGVFLDRIWEFLSDDPREANTEGGVFPAIFGTVLMVILMSIVVTPFGVIAAVYLREYATQGWLTRTVRIAVNNLAGVPSIVYGVFGLGFFVYFLGGNIDDLFFPEAAPSPVFGTPGLLWASLTLALLTLPVVIVSTEEGLTRVPKAVREGSLALGATKAETLWKTVLPMASPSIMTGVILAIARAAGEVAPLMLVGVVKLAPSLPLDGNPPFLHLERQFMHLGFHIYDVGFQSPNVEAARPLVYATSLLLLAVIVLLNLTAIRIRNRLREKYKALEH
ncbi:MAG: phosphate ABC transporter permease PstA [Gammaproteobacteria bacterium]|nr:MAG: phosphate ABC transporter permease PstA [Gammaproteobacteria bacterium]